MRYREARAGTLGASEVETGGVDSPDVVSSAGDGIQSEDRTIESSTGRQQLTRSSTARPRRSRASQSSWESTTASTSANGSSPNARSERRSKRRLPELVAHCSQVQRRPLPASACWRSRWHRRCSASVLSRERPSSSRSLLCSFYCRVCSSSANVSPTDSCDADPLVVGSDVLFALERRRVGFDAGVLDHPLAEDRSAFGQLLVDELVTVELVVRRGDGDLVWEHPRVD